MAETLGITHVSDTALLVAGCRAVEAERADAFVRDPFAARLAGERGMAMFRALAHQEIMGFGIAIRTRFVDELLLEVLAGDVKTVVSLGAGLDTKPWRLEMRPNVRWIEVDFAAMLDFKESLMDGEKPRCLRERLVADVNDPTQRRAIYEAVGVEPAVLITEGLLMYLPARTVEALASEMTRESSVAHWIIDATTSQFSKAIGGSSKQTVGHVQAQDHLEGEEILATICRSGWKTAAHRSYIRDLAFASERIAKMIGGKMKDAPPPPFAADEPSGVHRFER
jgi:methyltransferase (TIGR00027 family)